MGFSKILLLFFFFIFYFYTIQVSSANDECLPLEVSCDFGYQPYIQFPFSVEYFGSCAYPGFNMSCNDQINSISIQIGSWGEFFVQDVDYLAQKVRIYDQHNCLPKRLLSIDLSDSPFRGAHHRNFTFYNCSSEFSTNVSSPISCLGTQNHTVYATSIDSGQEMFSTCDVIASVMVPSQSRYQNDEIINDLHLVWDTPDCRECLGEHYGVCGFKNIKTRELKCFLPKHGLSTFRKLKIGLGVGISVLMSVVMTIYCIAGKRRSSEISNFGRTQSLPTIMLQPVVSMAGLDESVIQSYPRTVLGESRRLEKPEDNTCSICLSEYQAKETLKTIPDCKHCFHAACIDEWLRKNVTCPICRHAPMPSPHPL
ncbi:hypothetical protein ACHQM5_006016 [Ranunculus cassubicifolius]